MSELFFAAAILFAQETPAPAPAAEDLPSIEKKIAEREARRAPLERKIREAVDRNETEVARRLNEEFNENEAAIDALKKKRDEIKAARGTSWTDNVKVSGQAMLTRFDKGLSLKDQFGWGASATLGKHLFFEYQRWETRDELGNAPAAVQTYQLGLTGEHGFGLCDTGPVVSLRPEWKYYFNNRSSFSLGGDFDFVWTDFNAAHTHPRENQSLFLSIEFAF